jgi:hypothetical protein
MEAALVLVIVAVSVAVAALVVALSLRGRVRELERLHPRVQGRGIQRPREHLHAGRDKGLHPGATSNP